MFERAGQIGASNFIAVRAPAHAYGMRDIQCNEANKRSKHAMANVHSRNINITALRTALGWSAMLNTYVNVHTYGSSREHRSGEQRHRAPCN